MCEEFGFDRLIIPKKIDIALTRTLQLTYCDRYLAAVMQEVANKGWTFYVVDQRKGWCVYTSKYITIPVWALQRNIEYAHWYIAHELAHALNFEENGLDQDIHGPVFMSILKKICPVNAIHYELTYKPRNAAQAGIFAIDF